MLIPRAAKIKLQKPKNERLLSEKQYIFWRIESDNSEKDRRTSDDLFLIGKYLHGIYLLADYHTLFGSFIYADMAGKHLLHHTIYGFQQEFSLVLCAGRELA